MKKFFLTICFLGYCTAIFAAQLTPAQQSVRQDIFIALKKIATNVTLQDGEYIRFTANGIDMFVHVNASDYNPMYVTLGAIFEITDAYNKDLALEAGLKAAEGMPVYVATTEETLLFDCEMYIKESKAFTSVLASMIQAIATSASNFYSEYEKIRVNTHSSVNNSTYFDGRNFKEFIFPEYSGGSNDSKLYLTKVTIEKDKTVLHLTSYNGREYQNCGINRNSYLLVNGSKLGLIRAEGISYTPQYTDYPNYESGNEVSLSFKLYFPPLPSGTHTFDFTEGSSDGWAIHGIKLNNQSVKSFNSESIETNYHTWWCIGINCQESQTVIMKRVTPKSSGTYMYSSHDEFIEDADTGRKYYLIKSSLGFSTNPTITYSTQTIDFAEVYPALPKNVRRINISSGGEYYIKNLQIR